MKTKYIHLCNFILFHFCEHSNLKLVSILILLSKIHFKPMKWEKNWNEELMRTLIQFEYIFEFCSTQLFLSIFVSCLIFVLECLNFKQDLEIKQSPFDTMFLTLTRQMHTFPTKQKFTRKYIYVEHIHTKCLIIHSTFRIAHFMMEKRKQRI